MTPSGKPAPFVPIRGLSIAMVLACLITAPAAAARAAVSCTNFETMPAPRLITAVQWESNYGLVPPPIGCERSEEEACEFQNTLVTDKRLGAGRRLIVVKANHLLGSGAHDILTVYACRHGKVSPVLTGAFEYGINIERADAAVIVFTAGLWQGADAHCCPSHKQRFRYAWNAGSGAYKLEHRETFMTQP